MNHWKESGSRQPRGDRHVLHRWKQGVETGGRLINVLKKKIWMDPKAEMNYARRRKRKYYLTH